MKILSKEVAQFYQISSLNRGHLVFTSLIAKDGRLLFLDCHIERLLKGASFLFPEFKWQEHYLEIKKYIEEIFKQDCSNFYFRLTIFDDCLHLEKKVFEEHVDSLKVTTALKIKSISYMPSFLKSSNYLEADLELRQARLKNFDDVIFFDNDQMLTEATTSNIFVVMSDGMIKTPPLSSMVLDGVIRQNLLKELEKKDFAVKVTQISKIDLLSAKEIWFTNSVKGLRFVSLFEKVHFKKENSTFNQVVKFFGRYGELT